MESQSYRVNNIAPAIGLVPKVVGAVGKVAKAGEDVIKSLGGFQIAKGYINQKGGAGIAALKSMGYTTDQIRNNPVLLGAINYIGTYPMTIDTVVKTADSKIKTYPGLTSVVPAGVASKYYAPAKSQIDALNTEIFGSASPVTSGSSGVSVANIVKLSPETKTITSDENAKDVYTSPTSESVTVTPKVVSAGFGFNTTAIMVGVILLIVFWYISKK